MSNSNFYTLDCPSCGAQLQITKDIDLFVCGNCGNKHILKRTGGIVTAARVVEQLVEVQKGLDKTGSELAIKRLQEEINSLNAQRTTMSAENERLFREINTPIAAADSEIQEYKWKKDSAARQIGSRFTLTGIGIIGTLIIMFVVGKEVADAGVLLPMNILCLPFFVVYLLDLVVRVVAYATKFATASKAIGAIEERKGNLQQEIGPQLSALKKDAQQKLASLDQQILTRKDELDANLRIVSRNPR